MAGDWIKMRVDLIDDPTVAGICVALSMDEFSVIGRLHKLWSWADRHTSDGMTVGVDTAWVDRYLSKKGFAAALISYGWLAYSDDGVLSFPGFEKHNGASSKLRCDAALRQRRVRTKPVKTPENVTDSCDKTVTEPLLNPLPEERRGEESNTDTTKGAPESDTPSLEIVKNAAAQIGVTAEIAEIFFNECESRPLSPRGRWTSRDGTEIAKWRNALKSYSDKWSQNQRQNQHGQNQRPPRPGINRNAGTSNEGAAHLYGEG